MKLAKLLFVLPLLALAACSGGAQTSQNPVTSAPTVSDYRGPAPSTADVQSFRINLWENIKATNRCGGCHNPTGETLKFARSDDVNLAYADATRIVTLTQPDQSRMVLKVAGGHNCWLSSNQACADILTTWIRNWAGSVAGGGTQIQLTAPVDQTVGDSRVYPDASVYGSTIWPIVTGVGRCANCHAAAATTPQSPQFANRDAADMALSYSAARPKINLDDAPGTTLAAAKSRLVVRLRDESHNCWSSNCAADAAAMLAAVQAFVGASPIEQVDPSLVVSRALKLYDGTVAAGGNRYDTNVIARYEFKEGSGGTVFDTSGVEPALNLNLTGNVSWVGGWGIDIKAGGKAQGTTTASRKLSERIKASGEYSIELWAAPANVVQEDAFLLSYSGGTMARNVTLAQRAYQYEAFGRASTTGANGTPALLTRDADRDAQASLQHVVLTYDPVNGRRLFVNGNATGDVDPRQGGSLADWDDTFALVLGNETSNDRQWQGVIKLAAVHSRALTASQVQQNFAAGVGERYFLLFNVSELTGVSRAYILLEASQYDSYSYLFSRPTFISLDPAVTPGNIPVRGIRIGVNGAEAQAGQAFANVDTAVTASGYTARTGQLLSDVGTVVALQRGPESDMFFLSFDLIGTRTHARTEPALVVVTPSDQPAQPDIGVRTFDQLNHSMSLITGVPVTNTGVRATYLQVRQQLPPVSSIEAFLASHQTGIAQLAIKYCAAMVDDPALRAGFFGGSLNLATPAATLFAGPTGRSTLIDPLLARVIGANLSSQPLDADVRTTLSTLIDRLVANGANSPTVAKAACAATLGSAALTVQ
jgi:hypothetical protein